MEGDKARKKTTPSLFDVVSVGAAWIRRRWNLFWLVPDLVFLLVIIVMTSAYLPALVNFIAGYVPAGWAQKLVRAALVGLTSTALVLLAWKTSKRLCRYNWQNRSVPMSLLSIVKTGLLLGAVVSFHYGGATKLLMTELELPAMSSQAVVSHLCSAPAPSANESVDQAKKANLATPIIEAAYRELTNTPEKRAYLARSFQQISWQYACPLKLAAHLYDLPPSIIAAVIVGESGGDAQAVSPKGAKGAMQLMPVNYGRENPFDALVNIELGSRLLRQLLDEHGDMAPALAHYNASNRANEQARKLAETLGASDFWLRREFLPEETRGYVPKILALEIAWEEWKKHGRVRSFEERHGLAAAPAAKEGQKQQPQKQKWGPRLYIIKQGDTAFSIAQRAGVSLEELKRLNAGLNPKRIQTGQVLRLPSNS